LQHLCGGRLAREFLTFSTKPKAIPQLSSFRASRAPRRPCEEPAFSSSRAKYLRSDLRRLFGIRLPHRRVRILFWRRRLFDGRRHRLRRCAHAVLRWQRRLNSHHDLHATQMPKTLQWKPAPRPGVVIYTQAEKTRNPQRKLGHPGFDWTLEDEQCQRAGEDRRRRNSDFYCFSEWSLTIYAGSRSRHYGPHCRTGNLSQGVIPKSRVLHRGSRTRTSPSQG
jgi:hypothetical protein